MGNFKIAIVEIQHASTGDKNIGPHERRRAERRPVADERGNGRAKFNGVALAIDDQRLQAPRLDQGVGAIIAKGQRKEGIG